MLHGLCVGEEAGARNRVFFRVKWLQPAMKATSSVRRLRPGSFGSFYVFCNNGCSCVRSSMRFLKLWLRIALEWLRQADFAILALVVFLLKIILKSASKSSFLCFGVEIRFWSCNFRHRCAWFYCVLQLSLCRSHCNGCVKVAWCRGCMRNTIVFCSCIS